MYEHPVKEVELSSLTPLVFSIFGVMGVAATTTFWRLASLSVAYRDQPFSVVMVWIKCSISFLC